MLCFNFFMLFISDSMSIDFWIWQLEIEFYNGAYFRLKVSSQMTNAFACYLKTRAKGGSSCSSSSSERNTYQYLLSSLYDCFVTKFSSYFKVTIAVNIVFKVIPFFLSDSIACTGTGMNSSDSNCSLIKRNFRKQCMALFFYQDFWRFVVASILFSQYEVLHNIFC